MLVARKLLLGLIVAVYAPIPIRGNLKARGEFGKSWFLAGALEILDLVTIAFAAAHGILPVVQVYVLDRKLLHRTITPGTWKKLTERKPQEPTADKDGIIRKLERWHDQVQRWFDLRALRQFLRRQLRFVRVNRMEGELVYSLSDFAWTGMTFGLLSTVAGLLAPLGTFRVEPKWEELTRGEAKMELDTALLPLRILFSTIAFVITNIKLRKPKPRKLAAAPHLDREAQHGR